jgi:hypothetical protein
MFILNKEHQEAGLSLHEYDDYLTLDKDSKVLKLWYRRHVNREDVDKVADYYTAFLNKVYEGV